MNSPFKRPIIALILEIIGYLLFIASLVGIVVHFLAPAKLPISSPLAVSIAALVMSVVYYALGQIITFLSKSAFHAETLLNAAGNDIFPRLKRIEEKLSKGAASARATSAADAAPAAMTETANYYYSEGQAAEGPLSLGDLRSLRFAGVIDDSTLIYREGDTTWTPFEDLAEVSAV